MPIEHRIDEAVQRLHAQRLLLQTTGHGGSNQDPIFIYLGDEEWMEFYGPHYAEKRVPPDWTYCGATVLHVRIRSHLGISA